MKPAQPLLEYFWSRVDSSGGPDSCWLWQGSVTSNGYGVMFIYGQSPRRIRMRAHRFSYDLAHPDAPLGDRLACHSCDTPLCVNSGHIFAGSQQDNMDDARYKHRLAEGERNPHSKLTASDVIEIRKRRAAGATWGQLAKSYGVDRISVRHAVSGRTLRYAPTFGQTRHA